MIKSKNMSDYKVLNKVAKVTFLFWLLKILATTLGETAGDKAINKSQMSIAI